jgi:hypothetical protein
MPKFDVGIDGSFRFNGIEAVSGDAARDEILARFKDAIVMSKVERIWFQPSPLESKTTSETK